MENLAQVLVCFQQHSEYMASVSTMTTVVEPATAPPVLYGCMLRNHMHVDGQWSCIMPGRFGQYTGLRQTAEEVLEREQKNHRWQLQPADVILFSIRFSCQGWMHVTTSMRGNVPLLQRMAYWDGIDYGVWHFNDSIPLCCKTPSGELLFEVTFHPAV